MACDAEHRDGTCLGGMVKLYPPLPWGLVLAGGRDETGINLRAAAFGERHPARPQGLRPRALPRPRQLADRDAQPASLSPRVMSELPSTRDRQPLTRRPVRCPTINRSAGPAG
jgi:hypothetical protein